MTYYLGVDLGTTFTAAAVWRDGRVEVSSLGNRAPAIPSVVLLREDEEVLIGEAADRRGATEPHRVAREFKRRVGDPTPIIVGGTPYSADALTAKLLRSVVDHVTEAEGGPPAGLAICHPANWGEFKKDLLRQAITLADLEQDVATITEPEAAAIHYASQERIESGALIGVYDLGGGTFDAAVLRKADAGWEILGEPQGVERLGGVDFDEAVFRHVVGVIGEPYDQLDPEDPTARAAVARLRQECVDAKEALSADTDVSIPVLLPTVQTEVRLTRGEFEQMVRPRLGDSLAALRRALRLADVEPEDVTAVLLVGGSSRIPLVAQLVGSELGRPVAVDAHPKYGIALGAAMIAAEHGSGGTAVTQEVKEMAEPMPAPMPVPIPSAPSDPGPPAEPAQPVDPEPIAHVPDPAETERTAYVPDPAETEPVASVTDTPETAETTPMPVAEGGGAGYGDYDRGYGGGGGGDSYGAGGGDVGDNGSGSKPPYALIAGGIAIVVLLIIAVLWLGRGDDDNPETQTTGNEGGTTAELDDTTTTADDTTTTSSSTTSTTQPEFQEPYVEITGVELYDGQYRVHFRLHGFQPTQPGPHTHFFLSPTYAPENAGTNGEPKGDWHLTYETETFLTEYGPDDAANRGANQMCAVVADAGHNVADRDRELDEATRSGNCWSLPDH